MRNLLSIILISVTLGFFSENLSFADDSDKDNQNWTYFFYISGDNYNKGLTTKKNGKIAIEDQAARFFREIKKIADHDPNNNYAIYYDPKNTRLFHNHRRYYEKGGRPTKRGQGEKDSASSVTIQEFIAEAYVVIDTIKKDQIMFYYVGAGLNSVETTYSHDLHGGSGSFTYAELASGLLTFKKLNLPLDLLVMHSCFLNDAKFYEAIWPTSETIMVADGLISRSYFDLTNISTLQLSSSGLVSTLLSAAEASPHPHPFTVIDRYSAMDAGTVYRLLTDAVMRIEPEFLNQLSQDINEAVSGMGENDEVVKIERLNHGAAVLTRNETLITFEDYISEILSVTDSSTDDLAILGTLLDHISEYKKFIMVSLPPKGVIE